MTLPPSLPPFPLATTCRSEEYRVYIRTTVSASSLGSIFLPDISPSKKKKAICHNPEGNTRDIHTEYSSTHDTRHNVTDYDAFTMTPSPRLDDTCSVWLRMLVLRYKRMLTASTAVSDYWERVTLQPGLNFVPTPRYRLRPLNEFGLKWCILFLGQTILAAG